MLISEILDDWFLKDHEVKSVLNGTKTIILVPENIRFNELLFCNGMTLKVLKSFKKSFKEFNNVEFREYGMKHGVIEGTCEHPPFDCLYYGTTMYSHSYGYKNSFDLYIEYHDQTINTDTVYQFVQISNELVKGYKLP